MNAVYMYILGPYAGILHNSHLWCSWELHSWQYTNKRHWLLSIVNFCRLRACNSHIWSDIDCFFL